MFNSLLLVLATRFLYLFQRKHCSCSQSWEGKTYIVIIHWRISYWENRQNSVSKRTVLIKYFEHLRKKFVFSHNKCGFIKINSIFTEGTYSSHALLCLRRRIQNVCLSMHECAHYCVYLCKCANVHNCVRQISPSLIFPIFFICPKSLFHSWKRITFLFLPFHFSHEQLFVIADWRLHLLKTNPYVTSYMIHLTNWSFSCQGCSVLEDQERITGCNWLCLLKEGQMQHGTHEKSGF